MDKIPFEAWKNRKPSIHHLHVWGCRAEARPYNPKESKLDSKTVSGNFIGYPEHSRGYKFYCPSHNVRVIETNKAVFLDEVNHLHNFEDLEFEFSEVLEIPESTSTNTRQEISLENLITPVGSNYFGSAVNDHTDHYMQVNNHEPQDAPEQNLLEATTTIVAAPVEPLRRSTRERKSALPQDYIVYLQEVDCDIGEITDPVTFKQAIESE